MIHLSKQEISETKRKLDNAQRPEERRMLLQRVLKIEPFLAKRNIMHVGGLPIHCEIYESGKDDPVIVFLPGIGTYTEMYCEFLSKLATWGFNVVGVDFRGHGYSGGERGEYTVSQVISDMKEVLDVLSETYTGPIGLLGCSIGASMARAYAENDPRIKALMCHTMFLTEFPPDVMTLSGWNVLRMSRLFLPDFKIDFRSFIDVNSLLRGNYYADFVDYDPLIVWEYSVNTLSDIYSCKTRLLNEVLPFKAAIITGEKDEVIPVSYMRYIVDKMKHPFDFIELPGARHMLPFLHVKDTVFAARDWFNMNLRNHTT